ncbi:hypothetical protein LEP1GSC088_1990 [Leptospira interrogans str. L1207]|nr:hypothetical protein LEP1GSC088_1990 [Leptospira interrogans str. L1207]
MNPLKTTDRSNPIIQHTLSVIKNETINRNKLHQVGIGHSKLENNRIVEKLYNRY